VLLTGPLRRQIASRLLRSGFMSAAGANQSSGGFRVWSNMSERGGHGTVVDGEFTEEADSLPQFDPAKDPNDEKNN